MKLTLAMIAYRQEAYVAEAVKSMLAQTISAEIILSDDCSPDSTFDIIRELAGQYAGPMTVRVRQNSENLGLTGHVNAVMQEARGDVVLLAAGDDISLPTRCEVSRGHFQANPALAALSLRHAVIDETGKQVDEGPVVPSDPLTMAGYFQGNEYHPSGASRAYSRRIFEVFGPLSDACPTEDTTMLLRAILLGEMRNFAEVGVLYRWHGANLSSSENLRRMDVDAIRSQQLRDIGIAQSSGLIESKTRRDYEALLGKYWARRRTNTLQDKTKDQSFFAVLPTVLKEQNLTAREKWRLYRRLLRRRLRG